MATEVDFLSVARGKSACTSFDPGKRTEESPTDTKRFPTIADDGNRGACRYAGSRQKRY